jgi:hypothetical protein
MADALVPGIPVRFVYAIYTIVGHNVPRIKEAHARAVVDYRAHCTA